MKSTASRRSASRRARHDELDGRVFTSREAAIASGVPFFTIDYWGRTRFLVPTVSEGNGRGKGRQRLYSYGDLIRLAIARELRDQRVSLETLRSIVQRLAPHAAELAGARYAVVGRDVELATSDDELLAILRRRGRRTFGIVLDLRELVGDVRERAARLPRAAGA